MKPLQETANHLSKWKTSLSRLWSEHLETSETRTIELDETAYSICREVALSRQISVHEAGALLVRHYEEERLAQLALSATEEQIERNPLLALDSLVGRTAAQGDDEDDHA